MSTAEGDCLHKGCSLPLVRDDKVKAGCCTFDILSDGEIKATKHPSGYLIPYLEGCRTNRVQFLSCTNVVSSPKWPLVFASKKKDFYKMEEGDLSDVMMILIRGLKYIS